MSDNNNGLIKMFTKTWTDAQERELANFNLSESFRIAYNYRQTLSDSPWRQSSTNARLGIMTFAVNVEGGGELLIDFEMPINEIVERTSDGFVGQPLGATWRHTNPEWYLPLAKTFIRQKLDEMGYDFIESQMLAIKRTGIWG